MQTDQLLEKYSRESKISGLVTPSYDGYCVSNLPDSFSKLLGVQNVTKPLKVDSLYELSGTTENLVFLLLDGFGFNLVKQAMSNFQMRSLRTFLEGAVFLPITTVFPSTTSTATTTLHTGLTPQEHGILGYTMYLQEIGAIVQMLRFAPVLGGRNSIFDLGIHRDAFFGSSTIHERMQSNGISSNLYISKWIENSGLSTITNQGAQVNPHLAASDMFVRLRKNLSSRRGPSFHFAYFASPDTIAHTRGPFSEEYASEVESLFFDLKTELIEKLDKQIAGNTTLIVSSDHGMVNIDQERIIDIRDHKGLQHLLKVPPTGDSRAIFLHTRENEESNVIKYFHDRFPNKFHIESSASLLKQGLFGVGEIRDRVKDRIGNLTAIPKGLTAMDNSDIDPRSGPMPGRHGGLAEDEMLVPLIARRLA